MSLNATNSWCFGGAVKDSVEKWEFGEKMGDIIA